LKVSTKSELKGPFEYQEETLVHLIHVQAGSKTTLFGPWGEDTKGNKRILLQLGNNMGGYLFLLFLGLRAVWKAINKPWISFVIFYFLLFFSWQNMDLILGALFFKNYLNSCNQNFGSFWWLLLLNFSVLTCESDSCILQFLNELNLTYRRLTGFVASFYSFQ